MIARGTKGPLSFAESIIRIEKNSPFTIEDRPYLPAIYAASNRDLVLRCSRQTEKSTLLMNLLFYRLATNPGIRAAYVAPRRSQAKTFCVERILATLANSPLLRRQLQGELPQLSSQDLHFKNGSKLYVRSCYQSADGLRGLTYRLLCVDEFQDIAVGSLAVMREAMSHQHRPQVILAGTPKEIDNQLETAYRESTQNAWKLSCPGCRTESLPNLQVVGPTGIQCRGCQAALDVRKGSWHAYNPSATAAGYWVNHLMVPWIQYEDILERRRTYEEALLQNEVLGLPSAVGSHVVTLAELQACCGRYPMANLLNEVQHEGRAQLVAGIDWGGGGAARTAICIGYLNAERNFIVVYFSRFPGREDPESVLNELTDICTRFGVTRIAADSGMGFVNNRLLYGKLRLSLPVMAITYGQSMAGPTWEAPQGHWVVSRMLSLSTLFSYIKSKHILFPSYTQSKPFLQEFATERYIHHQSNRNARYVCPENGNDDIVHATNYALLIARELHARTFGEVG